MKKLLPVVAALAIVILVSLVIVLGASMGKERHAAVEAKSRVAELESQTERDAAEIARLREHNEILRTESDTLRQNRGLPAVAASSPAAPTGRAAGDSAAAAVEGSKAEGKESGGYLKGLAKMFTDPEMKKVMRQQQGMGIRMMYGDLGKELGLSAEQSERALEILADRQMDMAAQGMEMLNGESDAAQLEAKGNAVNQVREDHDAKLRALLGDEGFAQFEKFERTVGDRFMMQQYQQQFSASGAPLQDEQREALLQIIYDERSRTPVTAFDPTNKDVAAQMHAMQSDEELHSYLASQEDFRAFSS